MRLTNHQKVKREMALLGFYNEADYAKLKGMTRQAIQSAVKQNRIPSIYLHNRYWIVFDNGDNAKTLYDIKDNLHLFVEHGFTRSVKTMVQNNSAIADVIRIDNEKVSIRFTNNAGSMISITADVRTIKIIPQP